MRCQINWNRERWSWGTWINARDIDQSLSGTRHGLHRCGVPRSCLAASTRVCMLLLHHSVRQHSHIRSHLSLSHSHSKTIQTHSKVNRHVRRERSSISIEIIRAPHGRISLWCWLTLKKCNWQWFPAHQVAPYREGAGRLCLYVVTGMVFVQSCPGGTYQEFCLWRCGNLIWHLRTLHFSLIDSLESPTASLIIWADQPVRPVWDRVHTYSISKILTFFFFIFFFK